MKIYQYNPITKEYIGTKEVREDPKHPKRYLIPAFATTLKPPAPRKNQKVVWNDGAWELENIPEPEPEPESTPEELRQKEIWQLEVVLNERYDAHMKLIATGADQAEIDECKTEIQIILADLEVLYSAESA